MKTEKRFKPDPSMILELVEEDDNLGICLACGEVQECIEPDAENYKCECCGQHRVFGAEQALLMI